MPELHGQAAQAEEGEEVVNDLIWVILALMLSALNAVEGCVKKSMTKTILGCLWAFVAGMYFARLVLGI